MKEGLARSSRELSGNIAGVFTKHRADDDLRDELESHLEMETAEYIRRGMHPVILAAIAGATLSGALIALQAPTNAMLTRGVASCTLTGVVAPDPAGLGACPP